MNQIAFGAVYAVALLLFMVVMLEAGRRAGARARAEMGGSERGAGAVEGAIFALLGLIMAFTFSGAAGRFDERRGLIVAEANAIGTAWLRIDLLPDTAQPALRTQFREYVDARLEAYRRLPDVDAAAASLAQANALQATIWKGAITAVAAPGAAPSAAMLFLPALNDMFDITTTRLMANRAHPPSVVYLMLFVLAGASAFFAGFGMAGHARRPVLHTLGFAAIIAAVVYVTIDIEHPRAGLVRVDDFDQAIVDVRESMK
jgi:hypothetical protein